MHPFPPLCIASTDRLIQARCIRGCHVFYPLRLAVVFFFFFFCCCCCCVVFAVFFVFFVFVFFDSKFSKVEFLSLTSETHDHLFSAERRQAPKQNSTLSVCGICASKRSFLLATKVVSKYHRMYHVNPV